MGFLTDLSSWLVATLEPYGPPGLMVIAIADSSFLSLPEVNDAALMALSISNPSSMVVLAAMTVIGSVIGCLLLYTVGRKGGEALLNRRFAASKVGRIRAWYQKYGMLAVIIPSLLPPPLPFKIFVLSAGAFRIPWMRFVAAVAIGRSVRYFTEGILAVMFGRQAIQMVVGNSGRIGVLVAVLIVVGVLIFLYTRRHKTPAAMMILPLAVALMREQGLELSGHYSKGVEALPDRRWDCVVTMGCGDRCPTLPAARRLDWDIPDPTGRSLEEARRIRDDLAARVRALLTAPA